MPSPVIRTTGNARPYVERRGYADRSRFSSRWERPAGEPSLAAGSALLIALFALAVLLLVCFSAPQSSDAVEQPASRSPSPEKTPGVEAAGGEGGM